MAKFLKVTLNYSAIAREKRQKDTLRGLGLRHRHQTRVLKDTPAVRGLIQKVIHLISFEETQESALPKPAKISSYQLGAVKAPAAPKKPQAKASPKGEPKPAAKASAPAKKKTPAKDAKKAGKTPKTAKKS